MNLDKDYWEKRYNEDRTGWDLGNPSPPLCAYIDQIEDVSTKILIPGAGPGHEAIYLYEKGFKGVTVIDLASKPLEGIKSSVPSFPSNQLVQQDFFAHTKTYDLILEQTFFCALSPSLRKDYVEKMHTLLSPGGKLAGLFFDHPLTEKGPPFGGSLGEYKRLFEPYFNIKVLERCYNSIKARQGSELFFIFERIK